MTQRRITLLRPNRLGQNQLSMPSAQPKLRTSPTKQHRSLAYDSRSMASPSKAVVWRCNSSTCARETKAGHGDKLCKARAKPEGSWLGIRRLRGGPKRSVEWFCTICTQAPSICAKHSIIGSLRHVSGGTTGNAEPTSVHQSLQGLAELSYCSACGTSALGLAHGACHGMLRG